MPTKKIALGVDIGGTKVAAGLVDDEGQIVFKTRVPMLTTGTADQGMEGVHSAIRQALAAADGHKLSGIGVASPGPLELPAGVVVHTPNLPCWNNFPLGDEVRRAYQMPTMVDNDANAAGLAEALWGAGKDYSSVFYVTLGTGIGTAIVLDGQLYCGRTGNAAESGHMTIDLRGPCYCGCGKRGCLEGLASGTAIARRARERALNEGPGSKLLQLVQGDSKKITARTVAQAWRAGDKPATEILTETADYLAVWLGNIVDLLEPDVFVIGGGLGPLMSEWFEHIRKLLPSCSINSHCQEIPLLQTKYGSDSGIAGAAALCFRNARPATVSG
jgi:glucokinase